jgi:hypothetical protein
MLFIPRRFLSLLFSLRELNPQALFTSKNKLATDLKDPRSSTPSTSANRPSATCAPKRLARGTIAQRRSWIWSAVGVARPALTLILSRRWRRHCLSTRLRHKKLLLIIALRYPTTMLLQTRRREWRMRMLILSERWNRRNP